MHQPPASKKSTEPKRSIEEIIDDELRENPQIRSGASHYDHLSKEFRTTKDRSRLFRGIRRHAVSQYVLTAPPHGTQLVMLNDGAFDYLFDLKSERTVLAWGVSKPAPPNSRDDSYLGGFPTAGEQMDKGHMMGHALGGREGGPNMFKQDRRFNRGWSRNGKLWRKIETYLAANADAPAFVRLIYTRGNETEKPEEVEYGMVSLRGQFRSAIFPNR